MLNLKKIIKLVLIAAFVCVIGGGESWAKQTVMAQDGTRAPREEVANTANAVEKNTCASLSCKDTQDCVNGKCVEKKSGSNNQQSGAAVTGCSQNLGLFSGLVAAGSEIFSGLRDLIYVVAGFGIIGVAVGGFFGNMNWKWLGAIVISLVVIATTGELITAITGCESYTSAVIQDTLK